MKKLLAAALLCAAMSPALAQENGPVTECVLKSQMEEAAVRYGKSQAENPQVPAQLKKVYAELSANQFKVAAGESYKIVETEADCLPPLKMAD